MASTPRIHDTLEIRRVEPRDDGTRFIIVDRAGRERTRLDEAGRFLVLQLDGLTPRDELKERYRSRFGDRLTDAGLDGMIGRLAELDLLNTNARGLQALRYLRDQGVRYRSGERERREAPRDGARRDEESSYTAAFDQAVFLLNDGHLEHALLWFLRLTETQPTDLRVKTIVGHLEFVLAAEAQPELAGDRRDPDWDAFDRALGGMLDRGQCPTCGEALVIELGATNHCAFCGASFSTYVLHRADEDRRRDMRS